MAAQIELRTSYKRIGGTNFIDSKIINAKKYHK